MAIHSPGREVDRLLKDPSAFQTHIQQALQAKYNPRLIGENGRPELSGLSVVFFLLGLQRSAPGQPREPCVILNKRSTSVRQPGDICCPGGGVAPRFDRFAAHLLRLPMSPLRRWAYYRLWQRRSPGGMARLRLLLTTALREGAEEMRLNPWAVSYQGILPAEQLVMFRRTIIPMVAWAGSQQRFVPNWEVEKIIRIPIRDLLSPDGYVGLRLEMASRGPNRLGAEHQDFPAFRHDTGEDIEILWGATYRITMNFLDCVFGFVPPDPTRRAVVEKHLAVDYLTGKG